MIKLCALAIFAACSMAVGVALSMPKVILLAMVSVNIKDYSLDELRGLMGIVTQEPILFNDTIANNITLGIDNATPEAIEHAAKIANAHNFILQKEEGYKTNIGDRGGKLSEIGRAHV